MLLFEWMVRAALVSALVGLTAWAIEEVVRGARGPARGIWVVALIVSIALPALALGAPDLWPEALKRSGGVIVVPNASLAMEPSVAVEVAQVRHPWSARD